MMIGLNVTFSHYVGETGIVSYAVVNYMHTVFLMLFIGVGAALQPISSYHYGAKLFERLQQFIRIATVTGFIVGVLIFVIGVLGRGLIIWLFGIEGTEVISYIKIGITLFFIGYLFLGINMVLTEFYQSIGIIRIAIMISLLRSFFIFIPLLFIMPILFGPNAIWLVFPIAEGLTMVIMFLSLKFKWIPLIPKA